MAKCFNHSDKEALNVCHSCGRSFCEDCLTEGLEYYYCKDVACQKEREIELMGKNEIEENIEENMDESQEEIMQKLYAFVASEMKAGADKPIIIEKMAEMGIDRNEAIDIVETIYPQIASVIEEEQVTASSIVPALIGGGAAAIVGGGIWGAIVIATGYVIGFTAWGIGLLCGFAVVLFSKGRKGVPLQVIAVLSSILGIVIGKYVYFFHALRKMVAKSYGTEIAANISILSGRTIEFFIDSIGSMVGGFDIIWVLLAIVTAWRIPKGIGIQLKR